MLRCLSLKIKSLCQKIWDERVNVFSQRELMPFSNIAELMPWPHAFTPIWYYASFRFPTTWRAVVRLFDEKNRSIQLNAGQAYVAADFVSDIRLQWVGANDFLICWGFILIFWVTVQIYWACDCWTKWLKHQLVFVLVGMTREFAFSWNLVIKQVWISVWVIILNIDFAVAESISVRKKLSEISIRLHKKRQERENRIKIFSAYPFSTESDPIWAEFLSICSAYISANIFDSGFQFMCFFGLPDGWFSRLNWSYENTIVTAAKIICNRQKTVI